jgi:hypothetical protein
VVFLGTPLRGTGAARDARWDILISGIMGKETSSTLVKDLEENSSSLESLVEDFGKMAIRDGLKVRCFTKPEKRKS